MTTSFLQRFITLAETGASRPVLHVYTSGTVHRTFSAKELAGEAAARSAVIAAQCAPGDLAFIISHDPFEQVAWWLGALFAGAVPGILTPPTAKLDKVKYHDDLTAILKAYPEARVFYGAEIFDVGQSVDARCYAIAGLAMQPAPIPPAVARVGSFIFQQSSGTTGLRKGILLSERAVVTHMESYGRIIGIGSSDVIVSWLPLYHDMGLVACLMQAIYWTVPLVLTSPFIWLSDAAWLPRSIAAHKATLCWLPNFAFKYLADRLKPTADMSAAVTSLRMVINCSEPVHAASVAALQTALAPWGLQAGVLSSCYAMAENTFAVTQTPPGEMPRLECVDIETLATEGRAVASPEGRVLASSGTPVPETEIRILKDGQACGDGIVGEIWIRSSYLMVGYVGVGAERAHPIAANGWYATGDLGYMRAGALFVMGRSRDLIIRAGRNVDPSYLEDVLVGIAGLKPGRWVVFGVDNTLDGTEDIVILAEGDGSVTDARAIKNAIVQACNRLTGIPPQKVEIVPLNWLVKSSSGKISRANCRKKYQAGPIAPGA